MELVQVGEKTYYIKNATNIGVYRVDAKNVYLIDTGNDQDAGKKILKIIEKQGWRVQGIINTHAHADHIGGNALIQGRTNCRIYANGIECNLIANPILEPVSLYAGCPLPELRNKFLLAKASAVEPINNHNLPTGLSYFFLPGHSFDMIGIKTSDNVIFLADALISAETINKYHCFYLYDIQAHLETLDKLATLEANWFIPAHSEATRDIKNLIQINRHKINELSEYLRQCCQTGITFTDLLKEFFAEYGLTMNVDQYALVGSTIRSYLTYLYKLKKVKYEFVNNQMIWTCGVDNVNITHAQNEHH